MKRPYKIAIAGTHSTGKTSFLSQLGYRLADLDLRVVSVHTNAEKARATGFPILQNHTFDSTAWMMAEAMQLETVAALTADVILVDRPVLDALGYLIAAMRTTNRQIEPDRLTRLEAICATWIGEYDIIFATEIDIKIPVGPDRNEDQAFRIAAGEAISDLLNRFAPNHHTLRPTNVEQSLNIATSIVCVK